MSPSGSTPAPFAFISFADFTFFVFSVLTSSPSYVTYRLEKSDVSSVVISTGMFPPRWPLALSPLVGIAWRREASSDDSTRSDVMRG